MTNKIKLAIIFAVFATTFNACKKDATGNQNELASQNTIKIDNALFSSTSSNYANLGRQAAGEYDEGACIVDKEAGTKCFVSVGSSCSKEHACEKVTSAAQSGNYTKEEIDQKIKLVEQAYGVKYTY